MPGAKNESPPVPAPTGTNEANRDSELCASIAQDFYCTPARILPMAFSLYDATIPQYLQLLGALDDLLRKAAKWCADEGVGEEALLQSRLASDMLPFAYQLKVAAHHSAGALHGIRKGSFSPQRIATPDKLDTLHARIKWALDECGAISKKEVNSWVGQPMRFVVRGHAKLYTAEHFLMSFSQPNFYFHVTTAYALMRVAGMDIGKSDYLGDLQTLDNPRPHLG